jgi:hypothetical protein
MIAKYPSKCRYCGKPITVGTDEYEIESKTSYHRDCHEAQDLFSAREAEELAERLHFERYDWDRLLRFLSRTDSGGTTGRKESDTCDIGSALRAVRTREKGEGN